MQIGQYDYKLEEIMTNKWLKKIKKSIAIWLVIGTTAVSTMLPVLANDVGQGDISPWSIGTLNEGEKYGIYPTTWYMDGFKKSISKDKLTILLNNIEGKLSALELEKDKSFTPISYEKDGTRGAVVTGLYNTLASYKLPEELEKSKGNAAAYMQKRGILNGTNKGLELEKACTVEQGVVLATKVIEDTYSVAQAGAKGFVWKVTEGDKALYLIGSIHIGQTNLYPIHQDVKDVFAKSDMLIVEANVLGTPEEMEIFTQEAMYNDGTSLQDHISAETYAKCLEVFAQYGLPVELYNQFKPWGISNNLEVLTISNSGSLDEGVEAANLGIDMYFLTTGMLTQKPVVELEGLLYQAGLFNSISPEMQELQLNNILDLILAGGTEEPLESADLLNVWFDQWYKGDIDGFKKSYAAASAEGEQGEYEKMLFGKRDKDMADKLAQLLEEGDLGTYFVVVGAGHLTIEGTIIDELESKGYTVERFWK